jgi:hypothetical protein
VEEGAVRKRDAKKRRPAAVATVEIIDRLFVKPVVVVGDFGRAPGDRASYRQHVGGNFSGAPAGARLPRKQQDRRERARLLF